MMLAPGSLHRISAPPRPLNEFPADDMLLVQQFQLLRIGRAVTCAENRHTRERIALPDGGDNLVEHGKVAFLVIPVGKPHAREVARKTHAAAKDDFLLLQA